MTTTSGDRECAVCGQFYPADPVELRQNVRELIEAVEQPAIPDTIRGLIVPHAGYMYSGFTAAHAYALLSGRKYSTIVVVSPSHHEYFKGVSVFAGRSYTTPLGTVCVDEKLRDRLLELSDVVSASFVGHGAEHAIEVHLPFMQYVLGEFTLLPLVLGDQTRDYSYALGESLAETLKGEEALLVASTDLSHYHPSNIADGLDAVFRKDVAAFQYETLMHHLETNCTEACGGGPTVAVMLALHRLGVRTMRVLHHCTSGDVTGDHSQVVGYLAAAAYA